jgi:carboxypeptidase Taq
MTRAAAAYAELVRRFARMAHVNGALSVLSWDQSAVMPEGGAGARADQMAALSVIVHEMITDPRVADLLADAEAQAGLDAWQSANLYEMRRAYGQANALPSDLVEATSKARASCEMVWRKAKASSDWAAVRAPLQQVLDLMRQTGEAKAVMLGTDSYDALLDEYEPGLRADTVAALFDDLAGFLPGFIGQVREKQAAQPVESLVGPFPPERQKVLGQKLMAAVGFDFNHGRLDVSAHPFCGGVPDDVRITTRYREEDFAVAIMGVLHETGHAMYERGLPAAWRNQPVGLARSMAVHESQSLIIEMQACRSKAFLSYAAPEFAAAFGGTGAAWGVENVHRLYTRVRPGFIRVEADEVSYPAHVILRFRLERALITGALSLDDLPAAWNDGMASLLGITPPDHARGVMQDIHWFCGLFGYFPTYTLGAMMAAQLFQAAQRAEPGLLAGLAEGDFGPLVRWLRTHVHGRGSQVDSATLLRDATGSPLDAGIFKAHLVSRYLGDVG